MSPLVGERPVLAPFSTQLKGQFAYHLSVLLRTPRAVVGGALLPIMLLFLRSDSGHSTALAQAQLVAGLAVFGAVSTAYITHTSSLIAARQAGVLKRWRATPLPPACYLGARIAATTLLAAAGGVLTALAGSAGYSVHMSPGTLAYLLLVLLLGAAAWASIGTAVSAMIPTVDAAWPILAVTYLPIVVLSGGFGAVSAEPGWLATIVGCLPVQPMVHSATVALHATTGGPVISNGDLAVLAAWAAAGLIVAQRWFRWAPRVPGRGRAGVPRPYSRT